MKNYFEAIDDKTIYTILKIKSAFYSAKNDGDVEEAKKEIESDLKQFNKYILNTFNCFIADKRTQNDKEQFLNSLYRESSRK